ncbi:sterol-binding protein [Actinocrinis puniceicyclus]|uniref:Sterol-binding protein n=2 Tax=Actinocrinis puniceicyclus TaxID=977794 RepID=A0A8J8BFF6_9ACTN|nr:sterol-binding protein [Actinocrinis puniceicyclus]
MGGLDEGSRDRHRLERTVSCHVPDLETTFHGLLKDARLLNVVAYTDGAEVPQAQIRLTIPSDELLMLVDGGLNFISAWTSGRIKVNASFGDLIRLRKIF